MKKKTKDDYKIEKVIQMQNLIRKIRNEDYENWASLFYELLFLIKKNHDLKLEYVTTFIPDPRYKFPPKYPLLHLFPENKFIKNKGNIIEAIILNESLTQGRNFFYFFKKLIETCDYSRADLIYFLRFTCSLHINTSIFKFPKQKIEKHFKVIKYLIDKTGGIEAINKKNIYNELLPRFLEQRLNEADFKDLKIIIKNLGLNIENKFNNHNIILITGVGHEAEFVGEFRLIKNIAKISGAKLQIAGRPNKGTTLKEIKKLDFHLDNNSKNIILLIGHGENNASNEHVFILNNDCQFPKTANLISKILENIKSNVELITTTCFGNCAIEELRKHYEDYKYSVKVCALGDTGIRFRDINKAFEKVLTESSELSIETYLEQFIKNATDTALVPKIFEYEAFNYENFSIGIIGEIMST